MLLYARERIMQADVKPEVWWPDVFTDPEYVLQSEMDAITSGLAGWGYCYEGKDMPMLFGAGMCKIGAFLGISCVPKNIRVAADVYLQKQRNEKSSY
jgi:hypothetical protein